MKPRFKQQYRADVIDALKEQLDLGNIMQVPRLEKIVVNMGVGDASQDGKLIDAAVEDLRTITGQQPRINRARKSVANSGWSPASWRRARPARAATSMSACTTSPCTC